MSGAATGWEDAQGRPIPDGGILLLTEGKEELYGYVRFDPILKVWALCATHRRENGAKHWEDLRGRGTDSVRALYCMRKARFHRKRLRNTEALEEPFPGKTPERKERTDTI